MWQLLEAQQLLKVKQKEVKQDTKTVFKATQISLKAETLMEHFICWNEWADWDTIVNL